MSFSVTRRQVLGAAGSALMVAAVGGARAPALAAAAEQLAAFEAKSGGRLGLAATDTGGGGTLAYRADERFPFCSTFKVLAASAILRRAETEPSLLERRIPYGPNDLVRYSPVTSKFTGNGLTLGELCAAGLQFSDNTAANLLIRTLGGPGAVTAFARGIGDEAFRLDRWETELNEAVPGDPRDTTTPAAMAADLSRLGLGDALAPKSRAKLVDWMRGCKTGDTRIRAAAVPTGWMVADKTGSGAYGTTNDIALLWPPGQAPIILAIYFTQPDPKAPHRDDVVSDAARLALNGIGVL